MDGGSRAKGEAAWLLTPHPMLGTWHHVWRAVGTKKYLLCGIKNTTPTVEEISEGGRLWEDVGIEG